MRLIGTVAGNPSDLREVMTGPKKDKAKTIQTLVVIDDDGGIVTLQEWGEPGKYTDPFKGLKAGVRIQAKVQNPDTYQGQTRASLAEPIKPA